MNHREKQCRNNDIKIEEKNNARRYYAMRVINESFHNDREPRKHVRNQSSLDIPYWVPGFPAPLPDAWFNFTKYMEHKQSWTTPVVTRTAVSGPDQSSPRAIGDQGRWRSTKKQSQSLRLRQRVACASRQDAAAAAAIARVVRPWVRPRNDKSLGCKKQ